jgi:hypothetical protein
MSYVGICGAPEERPDHGNNWFPSRKFYLNNQIYLLPSAILCVHMGLSMVKAIKYVREKTKSSVDMRVCT